jgi:7,8-dihydropterin-6-yl-methyl-4-(beta-D-ribofuranosyl)aminobenzene 5'-phosphate synthase
VTLLVDNQTLVDRYFLAEPAFSAWIESENTQILFDTGYSDVFLENAKRLNLEISELDVLALSHGHSDHTWGLPALANHLRQFRRKSEKVRLVAHPEVFFRKECEGEIYGVNFSMDTFMDVFEVCLTATPVDLGGRVSFLGEIERKTTFECKESIGSTLKNGAWIADAIQDDSALVYQGEEGLVIITGCAHSGIVNIVKQATAVTGQSKIIDILGGLHLQQPSVEQMEGTASFLESLGLKQLHACHCTDLSSKCRLLRSLPLIEVGSGSTVLYL